eukprot:CAMPEP_0185584518 /NCGR_PEP_ID=MMETSP0434-20130131/32827_1 /TAXON_ID=626734 ORGANISM="Favella taraikaensis, Strain Fe Narragansett Bay" /NCGR_SAMPLE_ID=MMETSP0434 /ASSEMBLY_ACC=CAM_ASM_000379 /LENGTH=50 /DNA_ID=CAMNT_0028204307 /DNA_START=74 /DNA_END=226 /DNA_ORIENTATION=+
MLAKNPEMKGKEVFESGPATKPVFDGDFRRGQPRPKSASSSSGSSSSDSE